MKFAKFGAILLLSIPILAQAGPSDPCLIAHFEKAVAGGKSDPDLIVRSLNQSPEIRFFDGEERAPTAIEPGKSYTVIVRKNYLVVGKEIPGIEIVSSPLGLYERPGPLGGTKSHVRLSRQEKSFFKRLFSSELDFDGNAGAIRINPDGSIDVSGRHIGMNDLSAAEKIRDRLLRIVPRAVLRITAGRLSEIPFPGPASNGIKN